MKSSLEVAPGTHCHYCHSWGLSWFWQRSDTLKFWFHDSSSNTLVSYEPMAHGVNETSESAIWCCFGMMLYRRRYSECSELNYNDLTFYFKIGCVFLVHNLIALLWVQAVFRKQTYLFPSCAIGSTHRWEITFRRWASERAAAEQKQVQQRGLRFYIASDNLKWWFSSAVLV